MRMEEWVSCIVEDRRSVRGKTGVIGHVIAGCTSRGACVLAPFTRQPNLSDKNNSGTNGLQALTLTPTLPRVCRSQKHRRSGKRLPSSLWGLEIRDTSKDGEPLSPITRRSEQQPVPKFFVFSWLIVLSRLRRLSPQAGPSDNRTTTCFSRRKTDVCTLCPQRQPPVSYLFVRP